MSQAPSVVICSCHRAQVLPAGAIEELTNNLNESGVVFEVVPDLCELSGRGDQRLKNWAAQQATVVACFPRAVKWLFEAGGAPLAKETVLLNLRANDVKEVARLVVEKRAEMAASFAQTVEAQTRASGGEAIAGEVRSSPPPDWTGWFPVIDLDRCQQCMQCLSFCLFGVYGVDAAQRIQVQNPSACKTNCPACSRVCPHTAIMFPKYKSGPINGAPVGDADNTAEGKKIDISSLLGGDAHSMLRERSAKSRERFSKDRSGEQALSERRKYLSLHGLVAEDIPAEVLMNLPSPEEIARKAKEAANKAKAALEARKQL